MKHLNTHLASKNLQEVIFLQNKVRNLGMKQSNSFFIWGLYVLIAFVPFDFVNKSTWSLYVIGLWFVFAVFATAYYISKNRHVRNRNVVPWQAGLAIGFTSGICAFLAALGSHYFKYAWTAAGIVVTGTYLLYGLKLRHQGN